MPCVYLQQIPHTKGSFRRRAFQETISGIIKNLKQIPYIHISEVSFSQLVGNTATQIGAKRGKTNLIEQI
jgi:hypothetical protein